MKQRWLQGEILELEYIMWSLTAMLFALGEKKVIDAMKHFGDLTDQARCINVTYVLDFLSVSTIILLERKSFNLRISRGTWH